jgi:hypothetical protein
MAVIRDARPPAPQPLLLGDDHQTAPAWLAFFEQVGKRLAALTNDTATATNGYAAIPGSGVVLMWGTVTTDASGGGSVTFPAAFPTAAGSITATIAAGGPTICCAGRRARRAWRYTRRSAGSWRRRRCGGWRRGGDALFPARA